MHSTSLIRWRASTRLETNHTHNVDSVDNLVGSGGIISLQLYAASLAPPFVGEGYASLLNLLSGRWVQI